MRQTLLLQFIINQKCRASERKPTLPGATMVPPIRNRSGQRSAKCGSKDKAKAMLVSGAKETNSGFDPLLPGKKQIWHRIFRLYSLHGHVKKEKTTSMSIKKKVRDLCFVTCWEKKNMLIPRSSHKHLR